MKSRSLLISSLIAATAFGLSSTAFAEPGDAQAQAAALLSGARITGSEVAQTTSTSKRSGNEHPAVLVAHKWSAHGIDPNQFIVAHPARLQLLAASPAEENVMTSMTASTRSVSSTPIRESSR